MIKKILMLFTVWRVLLFVPLLLAPHVLPLRIHYEYTLVPFFTKSDNPINHILLFPWGNFDGIYYLLIAAKGYTVNAGFFPLFPALLRIITTPFGTLLPFDSIQYISALFFVSITFLCAFFVWYKLLKLDYADSVSFQSMIYLLVYPVSFYFVAIYSESLFFLLTLLAFYFARKKQWLLAGIAGGLLSGTRVVGIAILPALLIEFFFLEKFPIVLQNFSFARPGLAKLAAWMFKIGSISLASVGLLGYVWFNANFYNDPFFFIKAQGAFRNSRSVDSIVFPLQTVFRYFKILLSVSSRQYEWWIALLEICSFVFASMLLYLAWKRKVRPSYIVFSALCLLIPASTGTFSGMPRYILVLFPMFIALATIKSTYVRMSIIGIGIVLEFILLSLFARGYFVA